MLTPHGPHIVLIGFMGAGKSTVLAHLKAHLAPLGFLCRDLDELTVRGFTSISQMVEHLGWPEFRLREAQALREALGEHGPQVLALGGGTLEKGWQVLEQNALSKVIYLECPFSVCWQRIRTDLTGRPLVRQGEDAVARLFEERKELFERADLRLDATQSPEQVALAILKLAELA